MDNKQAIQGFAEFFKGITGNQNLEIPSEIAEKCGIQAQADVLDKIRAEIEQRKKNSGGEPNRGLAFNVCLQIIDRYRNEERSEE